jgi:hypothetical protein
LRARLGDDEREYVIAIAQSAFAERRLALQDGPDICFQRLSRELVGGVLVPAALMTISDEELSAYQVAHTAPPRRGSPPPVPKPTA